jgi:hypothetical protein
VKFMFLGGVRDHGIHEVATDPEDPLMPRDDKIFVPTRKADPDRHVYLRVRVETDPLRQAWWVYVLEGHQPTRRDLLDACPQMIF